MNSSTSSAASTEFDDLVMGAGLAGLAVASLLAQAGRRVLVLETHDVPGGNAHTFAMRQFHFCAQVHYIFGCGEGQTIDRLLRRLRLSDRVPFVRLDCEGYDHIVVAGERVRIPSGLARYREQLLRRYPQWRVPILGYFETLIAVGEELDRSDDFPRAVTPFSVLRTGYRFRHMLRYARSTLEDVYDTLKMPRRPCEWISTKPGAITRPCASMVSRAVAPVSLPIAAMVSPRTATSP